jgi:putative membrane protein
VSTQPEREQSQREPSERDRTERDRTEREQDTRRPLSLYGRGREPDPRFSMANERTALAWVRTALAFVAGGVGLTSVARLAHLSRLFDVVAVALCVAGAALAVVAVIGWRRRELAMRLETPLPAPVALPWLGGVVVLAALVLAVYLSLRPES